METDNSLLNEFIEEALEHLSTVEEGVLQLENSGFDKDVINRIFRSVHTVKGGSGFFALSEIFSLSHLLEDLLQKIRDGSIGFESGHVTPILKGVDALISLLEHAPSVPGEIDIPGTEGALRKLLGIPVGKSKGGEGETGKEKCERPPDEDLHLGKDEIPREMLKELVPGMTLFRVKLDLAQMAQNKVKSPEELLAYFENYGKVIYSKIPLDEIAKGETGFASVFVESSWDKEIFAGALNLPGQCVTAIEKVDTSEKVEEKLPDSLAATPGSNGAVTDVNKLVPNGEKSPSDSPTSKSSAAPESIRIKVELLDKIMTLVGEIVLSRNQLLQEFTDKKNTTVLLEHSLRVTELQDHIMRTRLQPVGNVFSKFKRIVRDIADKVGKEIKLSLTGEDVELDRSIVEGLSDPLVHLVRNSADHGLETPDERNSAGKPAACHISLKASNEGGHVLIQLEDDGRGIDGDVIKRKSIEKGVVTEEDASKMSNKEIVNLIFAPGFSTCDQVSDLSGRGVGMDVVKSSFEKHGGSVEVDTTLGEGTCISARLPLTLAIIPSLILVSEGLKFAIPQVDVVEIVRIKANDEKRKIESVEGQSVFRLRDKLLPVMRLADILGVNRFFVDAATFEKRKDRRVKIHDRRDEEEKTDELAERRREGDDRRAQPSIKRLVVLRYGKDLFGLLVDELLDPEEIVVKNKPVHLESCKAYSGASVMGDGSIAMVLNVSGLIQLSGFRFKGIEKKSNEYRQEMHRREMEERQRFIIFKNSKTEFFTLPLSMISRVEKVEVEQIERVGEKEFFQVKEKSVEFIRIENYIDVAPGDTEVDELFLLIPRGIDHNVGIVATEIVAVKETSVVINQDLLKVPGLLGSTIFDGHMTIFLDLHGLVELAFPRSKEENGRETAPSLDGRRRRILLVEDTPFFRAMERSFLESEGFEVVDAEDGKQGLDVLKKEGNRFDMIVSDIEMPVLNGYELVRQLKADPETAHIPVIALTALASSESKKKGLEAGFDEYQVKIEKASLLACVSRLLKK